MSSVTQSPSDLFASDLPHKHQEQEVVSALTLALALDLDVLKEAINSMQSQESPAAHEGSPCQP